MADNPEAVAAANPPVAPTPTITTPSLYDGLRVRLAPFVAATDAALGGGLPLSQEIMSGARAANTVVNQAYQELKDTTLDPKKRLDFLTGLVQPGSGAGDEGAAAIEGLYKGLRVRPASEVMVQPEVTSRATPTGETGSLPPEVHAGLEKQAGRELTNEEAVALDRANLERGMVSAPDNSSAIREQKRSELEKPRVYKDSSTSEQTPKQAIENAGMKYKGELVPGTGVHQFEHPEHPGKTAAMKEKDITPESVKKHMADVLAKFEEGKKLGK
jgi:hypothetical protein